MEKPATINILISQSIYQVCCYSKNIAQPLSGIYDRSKLDVGCPIIKVFDKRFL